jgi:hypothetical protein
VCFPATILLAVGHQIQGHVHLGDVTRASHVQPLCGCMTLFS